MLLEGTRRRRFREEVHRKELQELTSIVVRGWRGARVPNRFRDVSRGRAVKMAPALFWGHHDMPRQQHLVLAFTNIEGCPNHDSVSWPILGGNEQNNNQHETHKHFPNPLTRDSPQGPTPLSATNWTIPMQSSREWPICPGNGVKVFQGQVRLSVGRSTFSRTPCGRKRFYVNCFACPNYGGRVVKVWKGQVTEVLLGRSAAIEIKQGKAEFLRRHHKPLGSFPVSSSKD